MNNTSIYNFDILLLFYYLCPMPTITRKIELYIDKDNLSDEAYKEEWSYLHQINNHLYLAANRISSHCFMNDEYEYRLRLQMPEYHEIEKKLKTSKKNALSKEEIQSLKARKKVLDKLIKERCKKEFYHNMSQQNSLYRLVSNEFIDVIPGDVLTNINQSVQKMYNENRLDLSKGERTISTYKKGMPIPFSVKKDVPFIQKDSGEIVLKWFNGINFKLHFGKDRSNNRIIVERIIQSALNQKQKGEDYVINNSSIQLVSKDKNTKIFLLLSLDIPVQKRVLNTELVMGIDLGINYPLYYATNGNAYIKGHIGDRDSFLKERMVFQRRFKELQQLQCTQGGRGRKKKLEPLEKLRVKERNWVRTKNHIFSREVIKNALHLGTGTIKMEKLTNFGKDREGNPEDAKKYILRNWSYFELQTMIEYKAKMEGIKVLYVNPAYTSQRCNCCGEIGERKEQAVFKCTNPQCSEYNKEINADYNAARNIAKSEDIVK